MCEYYCPKCDNKLRLIEGRLFPGKNRKQKIKADVYHCNKACGKARTKERISFIDIEAQGTLAEENISLQKFNRVKIEGSIMQNIWKEKKLNPE